MPVCARGEAFEDDRGLAGDKKAQDQIRENLEDGLTVYLGAVIFDETDCRLERIYRDILEIVSENAEEGHEYVAIDDDLMY